MQTTAISQDNKIEEKIKEIIENVSNLSNEALIEFISSMAKFHNYSLHNQLILAYAGASQVASFKKWLELGRAVKKGEKAIYILAPKKFSKKEKDEETGEEITKNYIKGFIFVPVFDIKQTEGEEIKRGYTTASEIELDTLKAIAEKLGFSVDFKPMRINRGGYIAGKEIKLNSNLNTIENTGTLVHELAHGVLWTHRRSSRRP